MPLQASLKPTFTSRPRLLLSLCLTLLLRCPCGSGLRGLTPADHKRAAEIQYMNHKQPGGKANTAYGIPQLQELTRNTSVNHFGSVQYIRNNTFQMRYNLVWPVDPPTSIFLFCGSEDDLGNVGVGSGYYSSLANSTRALQIWPEHRYYADSARYAPADNFAQFTIEQALVDHIELVLHIQNSITSLTRAPVIALGASYSGQLASWLRMRYPDVIAGAISSSPTSFGCPGLGLDPSYDLYGPYQVVTRAASAVGGSAAACPKNVQTFFQTILSLGSTSSGRQQINQGMRVCGDTNVTSTNDVQNLAMYVQDRWFSAAQYNSPLPDVGRVGVPAYRVRVACDFFKSSNLSTSQLLDGMKSALSVFSARQSCLNLSRASSGFDKFAYQVCNQDQTPISSDGVSDMFFNNTFSLDDNDQKCVQQFGIHAQYNWAAYNFGLSALRQSSNIFFTNGNFDPYTACGPTVDISPNITTAVYEGCHACDFGDADPADPPSVTSARKKGAALIAQWISDYNTKLQKIPLSNAANLFQLAYSLGGYTQSVNTTLAGSGVMRPQSVANRTANYSNGATVV